MRLGTCRPDWQWGGPGSHERWGQPGLRACLKDLQHELGELLPATSVQKLHVCHMLKLGLP